jgi:murein DD-endopeptidase MepM/ murein hydrolase activator NlpD
MAERQAEGEAMKLAYPGPANTIITQTYDEHVQRAINNGWCWQPGNCPGGIYYYGGIDFGVSVGTPIHAALAGTVVAAQADTTGYGTHVKIQSGDYLIVYGHLSVLKVQKGDVVSEGEVIGKSGSTGNSTGPHLHFELRLKGSPIDPAPYLAADTAPVQPVAPVVPVAPAGFVTVTASDGLNVRLSPSMDAPVVGGLHEGMQVEKIGANGKWVAIKLWVSGDWVE